MIIKEMTRIQLSLPDELANAASKAGLLAPEAIQAMLREKLLAESARQLEAAWAKSDGSDISSADEQIIAEAIRKVRADRKAA
jgi:post-segregation antitoxin (ccd killing protein)